MKFLCTRSCQAVIEGKITFVDHDQIVESSENPKETCFIEVGTDTDKIDFSTAGEAELHAAKWKFEDAKKEVKKLYGVNLTKRSGETKGDIVAKILDARYRQVD